MDKVHKFVRGHESLSDIKILLQHNTMWSPEFDKYLNLLLSPVQIAQNIQTKTTPHGITQFDQPIFQ